MFKKIFKTAAPLAGGAIGGFFGGPQGAAAGAQLGGAISGSMENTSLGQRDPYLAQKEFAKHGIRWRVADAKAAGIHPVYALGAQTTSYAPSAVGDMPNMGQNIADAVARSSTGPDRNALAMNQLALERARLENDLIRSQIQASNLATMQTAASQPPMPAPGPSTGQAALDNLVAATPMTQTVTRSGTPYKEPAANPAVGYSHNPDGSYQAVMGGEIKDRLEEDLVGTIAWNYVNRLLPFFGQNTSPPPVAPKPGYHWVFDGVSYRQVRDPRHGAIPDRPAWVRPRPRPGYRGVRHPETNW